MRFVVVVVIICSQSNNLRRGLTKSSPGSIIIQVEKTAHNGLLKERLGVALPLSNNVIPRTFISLIQSEPNLTEVHLLNESLADISPLRFSARRFVGRKAGPVPIVQKDFKSRLLRQLARNDIKYNDARFYYP